MGDIDIENAPLSWPTPTVADGGKIGNSPNYGQLSLSNHPYVHGFTVTREKEKKSFAGNTNNTILASKNVLNADWVEQLIGLEVGTTQIEKNWK